ncbi:MAG TPA: hypothetical protein PLJ84_05745 [Bacteroidales bacterium]|nr:hypothetical protein [Paludibacteraceae bacterium]HPT02082.1 hypothetical protein [Bacteroidales bacterium]
MVFFFLQSNKLFNKTKCFLSLLLILLSYGDLKSQNQKVFANTDLDTIIMYESTAYLNLGGWVGGAKIFKKNNELVLHTTAYSQHLESFSKIIYRKCDTCKKNEFIVRIFNLNEPVNNQCMIFGVVNYIDFGIVEFLNKNFVVFNLTEMPPDSMLRISFCLEYYPLMLKLTNISGGIYDIHLSKSYKPLSLFENGLIIRCKYLNSTCLECSYKMENPDKQINLVIKRKNKSPIVLLTINRKSTYRFSLSIPNVNSMP